MNVLEEVGKHRTDIVTDTYTVTWREVLAQYKDQELQIDPDYQRLFRWDLDQQTQYIESLLLSIPSPPLFFAQNDDGKFEVIDGLQRISTLLKFFSKDLFDGEPPLVADEDASRNELRVPTTLTAGPIISALEGYTAATLPETLLRTIRYSRITVILIEKESSTQARYEVFRRLNKSGSMLSDQEIRNCTSRLYGKDFPTKLRALSENESIRFALSLTEDAAKRMGVEEAILRLLAFNFSGKPLRHEIREYLDDFMIEAARGIFTLTPEIEKRIKDCFDLTQAVFPDGKAFRFPRQGFSTNLFDVVATGIFHNLGTLTQQTLQTKHEELLKSEALKALTGAGSNTRKKLEGRIKLGKDWFSV